jgi:predicted DCC family thiol-disulfide oxidoreductase YuxK
VISSKAYLDKNEDHRLRSYDFTFLPSYALARMKVIFYDGLCPMCNAWVRRIIRWDKKKLFRFAPLESEMARETLGKIFPEYLEENTIVFFEDGHIRTRSSAALEIVKQLGFPYSLFTLGYILPKGMRDFMYRQVANRRYLYGQRYDSCPVPPLEHRDRFL